MTNRWMAEIKYFGGHVAIVSFEEIEDLSEIVERGPDWHKIDNITITLNRPSLTPQEAHG